MIGISKYCFVLILIFCSFNEYVYTYAISMPPSSIPKGCEPFGICERCIESSLEDVHDACLVTGRKQGYFCDKPVSYGSNTNTNTNTEETPTKRVVTSYDNTIYISCLRTPDEEAMRMILFIGFMVGLGGYFYYATQVRKTLSLTMFESRKLEHTSRTNH